MKMFDWMPKRKAFLGLGEDRSVNSNAVTIVDFQIEDLPHILGRAAYKMVGLREGYYTSKFSQIKDEETSRFTYRIELRRDN